MKVDLYNQNAKKIDKKVDLPDEIFNSEVNEYILSQSVYVYLNNQRESNAHTKDRSEVSGGGKKPWRQKGTGRARAGSSRSPIWKGGGVTFGPTNSRNFKKKLTKNSRMIAFRSSLSKLNSQDLICVVDKIDLNDSKLTSQASAIVSNFETEKITIVAPTVDKKLINAFANIANSNVVYVKELSVYDILNSGKLIILEESLDYISRNWGNKS